MNFKQNFHEILSDSKQDIQISTEYISETKDVKEWHPELNNSLSWIKEEISNVKTEQDHFTTPLKHINFKNEEIFEKLEPEEVYIKEDPLDNTNVEEQHHDIPPASDTTSKNTLNHNDQTITKQFFECTQCDYKTISKPSLKSHVKFHSKEKPFACTLCSYKTVDKSNLRAHLKLHAGVKSHKCTLCDYKTSTKFALKQHMTTHTGEKLYKCELCTFSSGFQASFVSHMRTHSGEKPFKCSVCDYHASTIPTLKNHMKIHNDERPYHCTQCEYKARVRYALKRHVKAIHSGNANKPSFNRITKVEAVSVSINNHSIMSYNINSCSNNEMSMNNGKELIVRDDNSALFCKNLMVEVCDLTSNKCNCHWCTN